MRPGRPNSRFPDSLLSTFLVPLHPRGARTPLFSHMSLFLFLPPFVSLSLSLSDHKPPAPGRRGNPTQQSAHHPGPTPGPNLGPSPAPTQGFEKSKWNRRFRCGAMFGKFLLTLSTFSQRFANYVKNQKLRNSSKLERDLGEQHQSSGKISGSKGRGMAPRATQSEACR